MNYQETVDWLFQQLPVFQRQGASAYKKDLSNTRALLAAIDHPERKFKSIHIAGTNGKGSIAHNLAATLHLAGYKTALYTSPHLTDFRERIKINAALIPKDYVVEWVERMQESIQEIKPSFFELTVALAFNYFADEKVDFAIVEVGMGGRLDSTNLIQPLLSVISNVSYDHQQFLGDNLPAIAKEKAGIIKAKTPVVIGEYHEETWPTFEAIAQANEAPLIKAFEIVLPSDLDLSEQSIYQVYNTKTSFAAVTELQRQGLAIKEQHFLEALESRYSKWNFRGRMHYFSKSPDILLDAAHNEAGLELLFNELAAKDYAKIHWVFGCTQEKKLNAILPQIPENVELYLCVANIPRSKPLPELESEMRNLANIKLSEANVELAIQAAIQNQKEKELVLIAGSIFLLAEAYEYLEE